MSYTVAAVLLVFVVYGLHAGWLIDFSGSILTGIMFGGDTLTGQIALNGDPRPYASFLESQGVFVTRIQESPGGLILVSGYPQDVMPALLKTAKLAQSRGHLVSYNILK